MKRLLKRWLAMALAVLMVVGTLPTTAFAARITDDVVGEQPVLSPDDPVADTQGRHDDDVTGEKPVDPVDPDGPSADLSAAITSITLANTSVTNLSGTIATGTGTGQDPVAVLIVPRFTTNGGDSIATTGYEGLGAGDWTGYFNNNASDADTQLADFMGMPYVWLKSKNTTFGGTVSVEIGRASCRERVYRLV